MDFPDLKTRAKLVADDPVAAAEFFHMFVREFLRCLIGSRADIGDVPSDEKLGVLGDICAHFATVESQGRGTLHLHFLVWLRGIPPPDELLDRMKEDVDYRNKVLEYLEYCIHQGFNGRMPVSLVGARFAPSDHFAVRLWITKRTKRWVSRNRLCSLQVRVADEDGDVVMDVVSARTRRAERKRSTLLSAQPADVEHDEVTGEAASRLTLRVVRFTGACSR